MGEVQPIRGLRALAERIVPPQAVGQVLRLQAHTATRPKVVMVRLGIGKANTGGFVVAAIPVAADGSHGEPAGVVPFPDAWTACLAVWLASGGV